MTRPSGVEASACRRVPSPPPSAHGCGSAIRTRLPSPSVAPLAGDCQAQRRRPLIPGNQASQGPRRPIRARNAGKRRTLQVPDRRPGKDGQRRPPRPHPPTRETSRHPARRHAERRSHATRHGSSLPLPARASHTRMATGGVGLRASGPETPIIGSGRRPTSGEAKPLPEHPFGATGAGMCRAGHRARDGHPRRDSVIAGGAA